MAKNKPHKTAPTLLKQRTDTIFRISKKYFFFYVYRLFDWLHVRVRCLGISLFLILASQSKLYTAESSSPGLKPIYGRLLLLVFVSCLLKKKREAAHLFPGLTQSTGLHTPGQSHHKKLFIILNIALVSKWTFKKSQVTQLGRFLKVSQQNIVGDRNSQEKYKIKRP